MPLDTPKILAVDNPDPADRFLSGFLPKYGSERSALGR